MTEKELKKLSRLELLELLLDVRNENAQLKEQVARLTIEAETTQNIDKLAAAIRQVEQALAYANRLSATTRLGAPVGDDDTALDPTLLDKEIYRCLLLFYADDAQALGTLPLELQIAVKERIPTALNQTT